MDGHTHRALGELADDVLTLYLRAVEQGQMQVGEYLLQALEELAAAAPECGAARDRAYGSIGHLPAPPRLH